MERWSAMKKISAGLGILAVLWGLDVAAATPPGVATNDSPRPLSLTGVNLAGGEFYRPKPDARPVYGRDYAYPNQAEIEYFSRQGMNLFRYPFLWETLQPSLRATLDQADLARLKTSVRYATSRQLIVVLDPHNYARYYRTNIVGGPGVSVADFADFWQRLAQEFKGDPFVWFGLVNEPHDLPTRQWFEAANACIAAIRGTGAANMILVPGNSWTGAHSWLSGGERSNARQVLAVKDPLEHWAIEVHQYLDRDHSGTHREVVSQTIGSERLKSFVGWCREHRMRAVLGEFAVPVVPNAREALEDLLASMERDRDVWLGWTWWAAGSRWGEYMFTLQPKNGQDRAQMEWLRPHVGGAAVPAFSVSVKNGQGQCRAPAGSVRSISAGLAPEGMTFKRWSGDTAWIRDLALAETQVTVPFKDIVVEALFAKP